MATKLKILIISSKDCCKFQFGVDFLKELFEFNRQNQKKSLAFKDELQGKTARMLWHLLKLECPLKAL